MTNMLRSGSLTIEFSKEFIIGNHRTSDLGHLNHSSVVQITKSFGLNHKIAVCTVIHVSTIESHLQWDDTTHDSTITIAIGWKILENSPSSTPSEICKPRAG